MWQHHTSPEVILQSVEHQRFQCYFLISLSLFYFYSGEIRSLDGKCYTVYIITKLNQSMSWIQSMTFLFSLNGISFDLNSFWISFSCLILILLLSFIYLIHFSFLACKAFCFFYGLQCKQTHPSNSTSGTTLSTELDCGKLIREERGIRTQPSIHTV